MIHKSALAESRDLLEKLRQKAAGFIQPRRVISPVPPQRNQNRISFGPQANTFIRKNIVKPIQAIGRAPAYIGEQATRFPARAGSEIALSAARVFNRNIPSETVVDPKSRAGRLFGQEPLKPIQYQPETRLSKQTVNVLPIREEFKYPLAMGLSGIGAVSDILPSGGGKKKVVKGVVKIGGKVVKTAKTIEKNFTPFNFTPLGKIQGKTSIRPVTSPIKTTGQLPIQKSEVSSQLTSGRGSFGNDITKDLNPQDPYFNVQRLNIPDKTKKVVAQVVTETKPQIEKVVGKKLSNKEAIDVANTSAQTIRKAVTRKETLAWESKMLRARQLLAKQATDGNVTKEYIDNLVAIKSQGTDIARKLQSLSIGADPKAITAKQAILEAVLKANKNADEVIKAAKGVDFNDLKQSTTFYRKFIKPTSEDWITLLRYNSMLSSPNTHIVNIASNAEGAGIIAPIEKTLLGGVDFLKSKVTGSKRQYFAGEGIEYAKGYYGTIGEAAQAFSDVMTNKRMIANPDLRYIPLTTKGKGQVVEGVLSFPMKMLEAADQFFQTMARTGAEKSLKYRASKGVKVANISNLAEAEATKRLFRSDINLKEQGTVLNAIDQVTQTVFSLRNNDNPLVRTVAKFTFPFVKTPMNILKQGVEYSPAGFTTLKGASNKTEQFTKALMGTSIGIASAMLLGSERLSWSEPTNATKRDNFRAAGLQPYSVKVGDKWVSYSKLHPAIAFNLALVAATYDAQKNKNLDDSEVETVMRGLASWWGFFADQSYVKNMGDFVASARGDLEGATRYISNYPQQLIPFRALMGWVTRLVDPNQRKVDKDGSVLEKQLQQIATQIPGLSSKVPARTDKFGNPIKQQSPLINAFSPNRVTTENERAKEYYDRTIKESKANKLTKDINQNKNEAIDLYLSGNKGQAKKMRDENNLKISDKDIKARQNKYKADAIDAYLDDDRENAKAIRDKYSLKISEQDIKKKAKSKAISLYKKGKLLEDQSLIEEAKALRDKYAIIISTKDIN